MKIDGDSKWYVLAFLVYALFAFSYSESITHFIASQGPFVILFLTTFLDPIYLLFLWYLFKRFGVGGLVAGFMFSIASAMVSLPHIILRNGDLSNESFNLISDMIFFKMLPESWNRLVTLPFFGDVSLSVFLVYVVISTCIVVVGFWIANDKIQNKLFKNSI